MIFKIQFFFNCDVLLQVITEATWLVHTRQLFDRSCLIQWFEHGVLPTTPVGELITVGSFCNLLLQTHIQEWVYCASLLHISRQAWVVLS